MSDHVTLTLRAPLTESIEADSIVPSTLESRTEAEIASLPIWSGRWLRSIGDYFAVKGGRSSSVRVVGDVRRAHGIGEGMTTGDLVIDGDAGSRLGAGMIGGRVDVFGSAGHDVGIGMAGGSIRIRRDAGDRVGAATPGASRGVTGGEIVVEGSVGDDAGARMRRGLLFVGGTSGNRTARSMIAGTVIVMGRVGAEPAFASKRGSLVVAGGVDVPVTYRYACDFEPPHVRLVLTYLARRYRLAIPRSVVEGRYRRYCGDASTVGRGEILELIEKLSFRA
jgi:formylmethanofuran dehydrogenase subunit C